jgi:hypothetical protein
MTVQYGGVVNNYNHNSNSHDKDAIMTAVKAAVSKYISMRTSILKAANGFH